ncbi:MAG: hypothetical protein FIA99_10235 [Ruminiclostridium sp.]|nr:hypothetical protein [Ruminiclostridium sp.]
MLTIEGYLSEVYSDFSEYINDNPCLCKLKTVNYNLDSWPDYSDFHVQQLYLLRYAFIYAFEYKQMYLEVLSRMINLDDGLIILSIGCGSGIDFWSAVAAVQDKQLRDFSISYYGLDEIDWAYTIKSEASYKAKYMIKDAVKLFQKTKTFPHNVFMFPKSIAEFTISDFSEMCDSLKEKTIEKDQLHVIISLRSNDLGMEADMERTKLIISALKRQGFTTKDMYSTYTHFRNKTRGIRAYDGNFIYPNEAKELINDLNQKCEQYLYKLDNCESDCKPLLTRSPAFTPSIIRYQILSFERR